MRPGPKNWSRPEPNHRRSLPVLQQHVPGRARRLGENPPRLLDIAQIAAEQFHVNSRGQ